MNENLYDIIYIINRKGSIRRLHDVQIEMHNAKLEFTRFQAIEGNHIIFTGFEDTQSISGAYLQQNKIRVGKAKYLVNCMDNGDNPITFTIFNPESLGWTPNEIGLWCSNFAIWYEAYHEEYNHTIIFEDDVRLWQHDRINFIINHFIAELPSTYDIAFLSLLGNTAHHQKVQETECLKTIPNRSWQAEYGAHAVIYSHKGLGKLLSINEVSDALDAYFFNHNIGNGVIDEKHFLEMYTLCSNSYIRQDLHSEMDRY